MILAWSQLNSKAAGYLCPVCVDADSGDFTVRCGKVNGMCEGFRCGLVVVRGHGTRATRWFP